jgi:hypothetical protein
MTSDYSETVMAEKEKPEKKQKQPKAEGAHGGGGGGGGKGGQKGGGGGGKKSKGRAAEPQQDVSGDEGPQAPAPPARLAGAYREQVVPALMQKFGYKNRLAVPRLDKIVISMGVGRYATEGGEGRAKIERVEKELTVIAGQ